MNEIALPLPLRKVSSVARLKGRITAAKRLLKNGEEEVRTLVGAMRRQVGVEHAVPGTPLFEPRECPMRTYEAGEGQLPVQIATPPNGAYMHTFFDVCPLSASGRYLAVTKLPFEHRGPYPGDRAEVCIIDLDNATIETVYRTGGWALQLGANIQWHPTDDQVLFCNDERDGRGVGVRIDRRGRSHRVYDAPFYAIDPTGCYMLSPALDLVNRTQYGYGIPERLFGRRHLPRGAVSDEGIWRTDLDSGQSDLLVSIEDLVEASPARDLLLTGTNMLFHTKINPQGDRIFQVLRSVDLADKPGAVRSRIMTLGMDGGAIHEALSHEAWDRGGHHPSWLTDGRTILMNLVSGPGSEMHFALIDDETGCRRSLGEWRGSGHPTIESSGRFLLTDAYLNEGFGRPDGNAPLRLIDLELAEEHHLLQLDCGPPNLRVRRVDPHPVWSRDQRQVVMNGVVDGRRQVLIADLSRFFDHLMPS